MTDNSNPIFHDEDTARAYLEAQRWPDGPYCPHCGEAENMRRLKGKSHRRGLFQCNGCRQTFTVTVGTLYERSKVPLHKWLLATRLLCSSKKGISSHQLHRTLGVTYKTAWFMTHRIREAMNDDTPDPMGGEGEAVQADETYFGGKDAYRGQSWSDKKGHSKKRAVVSLISGGKARTFYVKRADARTVRDLLVRNVSRQTELHTDESRLYTRVGKEFAGHKATNHSAGRYVGPDGDTTNAVENYFSIFKRGMRGVYQHCSEKHLQRYINEFDFRYNTRETTDHERTAEALKGITRKRLTYRRARIGQAA